MSVERSSYAVILNILTCKKVISYLLSFCFNKTKKSGLLPPVVLNGRTLIEAIV